MIQFTACVCLQSTESRPYTRTERMGPKTIPVRSVEQLLQERACCKAAKLNVITCSHPSCGHPSINLLVTFSIIVTPQFAFLFEVAQRWSVCIGLFGFRIGLWLPYDKKCTAIQTYEGIMINKGSLGFDKKPVFLR